MLRGRKRKLPSCFIPESYFHGSDSEPQTDNDQPQQERQEQHGEEDHAPQVNFDPVIVPDPGPLARDQDQDQNDEEELQLPPLQAPYNLQSPVYNVEDYEDLIDHSEVEEEWEDDDDEEEDQEAVHGEHGHYEEDDPESDLEEILRQIHDIKKSTII